MALLTLGDFAFEAQDGPETFEDTLPFTFAEHKLLEGEALLQRVGNELRTIALSVRWNASLHYPGTFWDGLVAMADKGEAMPLTWGSGRVEGKFVITSLKRKLFQLAPDGRILEMTADMELKKFREREPLVALERKQKAKARGKKATTVPAGPGYSTRLPGAVPPSETVRKPK